MTLEENFGPEAHSVHPKTFADLLAGKAYVHCPQCDGDGQVYAYWDPADLGHADYISCPCCGGTREALDDKAIEWLERARDRYGWDPE